MAPKTITIHQLSLIGLVGLIAAYCFLARATYILINLNTEEPSVILPRLYLVGLSLVLAFWGSRNPNSLAVAFPVLSVIIFIVAFAIPAVVIGFALVVAIFGINLSSWTAGWMFSAIHISPLAILNAGVAVLLAGTAKQLKENTRFKQWEIFVMLLGASWIGLAIYWSIRSLAY